MFLANADLSADFGRGIDAARFGEGHFLDGVLYGLNGFLHGEKLDGAGLVIHIGDVIFVGAVVLARGDQHGILDRVQTICGSMPFSLLSISMD